jgi:hypothetical protein
MRSLLKSHSDWDSGLEEGILKKASKIGNQILNQFPG